MNKWWREAPRRLKAPPKYLPLMCTTCRSLNSLDDGEPWQTTPAQTMEFMLSGDIYPVRLRDDALARTQHTLHAIPNKNACITKKHEPALNEGASCKVTGHCSAPRKHALSLQRSIGTSTQESPEEPTVMN